MHSTTFPNQKAQPLPGEPVLELAPRAWGWLGVCLLILWPLIPAAAESVETSPAAGLRELPNGTDIHHQQRYCQLCHETGPEGPLPAKIRFGTNFQAGCRCHYENPGDLRHPTDVALPEEMRPKIPANFPHAGDKINCLTCHSFATLCAPEKTGHSSLRDAPYPNRTVFCFRCHEGRQYERLNPHNQLDASGRIVTEKCLYCHLQKPDERSASFTSVKLIGSLEMLCLGCHNTGPRHPAGKPHLVKPGEQYLLRMRALEKEYGIVLPLNENGLITCITCHNPHEAGAIPGTRAGSKGAGEKLRHRLPKVLCAECHWHSLPAPSR